jgi:uncharacterized damage-inducible protein DinB
MPSTNDVLAHSLNTARALLNRYCEDLTPEEYLHRPCAGGNCVAWLLGHLVMTERQALGRVDVTDLPPLPEGFEKRFARDAEAPKASDFGDVTQLLPLFNRHRDRLIERVRTLPADALDKPLDKPHPLFSNVAEVVNFMGTHVAMHAGQITIIRRSLGKPPIV